MFTSVAQANAAVIEQIRRARPHWLDVQPASSLISELNKGKTLLHAGPPMRWQEMTGPMKGACVGACLFEGWAKDEAQALAILEQGEVNFIPCHHVNAVGPMGGITSASMPMLVVENVTDGNPGVLQPQRRYRQSDAFWRLRRRCPDSPSLDARCVNASIKRGAGAHGARYRSHGNDGAGHYHGR